MTSDAGNEVFVNIKDCENQIPLAKDEPVDFFLEAQADGRERAMKVRSLQPHQQQHIAIPPMFAAPPAGYGATYAPAPAAFAYPPSAYAHYQPAPVVGMPSMSGVPYQGVCKWFNSMKGFGFITPSDGSAELYFKSTDLQGATTMEPGETVRYEAKHQDGKSWAVNVMPTRIGGSKRAAPIADPYADYGAVQKQPKTQHPAYPHAHATAAPQRYEQPPPQPFAFDQYGQQATGMPKMAAYGAVPAQRGHEYEYGADPAAAYQQASMQAGMQYRQY